MIEWPSFCCFITNKPPLKKAIWVRLLVICLLHIYVRACVIKFILCLYFWGIRLFINDRLEQNCTLLWVLLITIWVNKKGIFKLWGGDSRRCNDKSTNKKIGMRILELQWKKLAKLYVWKVGGGNEK